MGEGGRVLELNEAPATIPILPPTQLISREQGRFPKPLGPFTTNNSRQIIPSHLIQNFTTGPLSIYLKLPGKLWLSGNLISRCESNLAEQIYG